MCSALAPWQRIDALKAFFFSSTQFAVRTAQFKKTDWERIDKLLRKEIKATLSLPEHAANEYFYGHRKHGCLGIPIAAEESDLNIIDSAFKLLTSRDECLRVLAVAHLSCSIRPRVKRNPTDQDLSDFLGDEIEGPYSTSSNKLSNTWTLARCASRRLNVEWVFQDNVPRLIYQDLILKQRRRVLFSIRDRLRVDRSLRLMNKNNQGKVLKLASLSPASSHFVSNGLYTRFADWRFIHKARLNLLQLNGCQQWKSGNDKLCRRCGNWAETLPHVINHCSIHSHAWQLRHNAIVDRLVQAMQRRARVLSINQTVCDTSLRPDITARVDNTVYIIDITCPFEGNDSAFTAAFENKSSKYEALLSLYQAQGLSATIVPFIVGALGSWCPWNDKLLKKFCTNSYIAVFRKLCVSDTIKWSRDIYTEHITGHRQYLLEDTASPSGDLSSSIRHDARFQFDNCEDEISQPVHLIENDEVALLPSDLEVRDLLFEKSPSAMLDFVKLSCIQCRRYFSCISGLELHMKVQHDITIYQNKQTKSSAPSPLKTIAAPPPELLQVGPCSGPTHCAPFSKIRPAKTWAAIAAKPAIFSSQPWSGRLINFTTSNGSTPRRPVGSRPSWPYNIRGLSSSQPSTTSNATSAATKKPKTKLSFTPCREDPDDVTHVVLLPSKTSTRKRKVFPCLHCDFTFRRMKSRDEHHVIHQLEDEFNRLHGLVDNSSSSNFDDFVLPDHKPKTSVKKTSASPSSTMSSRHHVADPVPSIVVSCAQGPSLSCHFCERDGFPNRKALKYHLFRLHQVPMGRPEPSMPTFPLSPAPSQVRNNEDTSPTEMTPLAHCAPSFSELTDSGRQVIREGQSVLFKLPFVGTVQCPDCTDTFTGREWFSVKGSIIKHLRFKHRISSSSSRHFCSICKDFIRSKPSDHRCFVDVGLLVKPSNLQYQCNECADSFSSSQGLRNHLAAHEKAQLRDAAPKLTLPAPSIRKRARKKRCAALTSDICEPSIVSDPAAVLAQPVAQGAALECQDDSDQGPLGHYLGPLDAFSAEQVIPDSLSLRGSVEDITQAAITHLFPDGPPSTGHCSSSADINTDDPATCQRLYTRNRRRAVQSDLTPTEVWNIFKKAKNTAPGPDRLTYHHLRSVDPGAHVLTKIFNACIRFRQVPSLWKRSTTILIHKGGDLESVSNWRPNALSNTAYKTFAKCLAARLSNWCQRYDVLSPCQKGFMPFDVVLEHNFILQTSIERARASKRNICIAWLDVTNAFGTLPHSAIFHSLRSNGAGEPLVRLVEDIYTQSATSILTEEGVSPHIPISSGVKQGCPLSGLLFNIAINPVLREIQGTKFFTSNACLRR
ncbi:transposon TX1 uncharacterized 149 kDa protein [Caerostris darwini]|uniref:Transposon TX1 uncharacterized 149 kDa protein n=1 Tax=Caerostris darwini TaxID=1538125 RepID=A0AAV4RRA8_9ARAC|nr:transposon TX1 uncharacterized 149 kDa protein [Caerostris darwini]